MIILEKILHSKKLSYEKLTPLMKDYITLNKLNRNTTTVNIFIDFYDVMKSVYNPKTLNLLDNMKQDERLMIASEVINMVSHYRHFFYSRMNMFSNIYFFYSNEKSTFHLNINENYKKDFYDKRISKYCSENFKVINRIIESNIKLIKGFLEYVPHAYFINTGDLEPAVLPFHIIKNRVNENDFNVIISNDQIQYQNLIYNDKTIILELRGEKSRIVSSENVFEILLEKSKKDYNDLSIFPDLIPVINGFSGNSQYNINGYKNMGIIRAMTFVQKCLDENVLGNYEYLDLDELKSTLKTKLKDDELDKFLDNFKMLSHYYIDSCNIYDIVLEKQLIDRIDARSVRYINEKYFNKYPILIDFCFEGEEYV